MAKPDKKSKKRDRESRSPAIAAGEDGQEKKNVSSSDEEKAKKREKK